MNTPVTMHFTIEELYASAMAFFFVCFQKKNPPMLVPPTNRLMSPIIASNVISISLSLF